MAKFKIGDRVRVIGTLKYHVEYGCGIKIGETGTILENSVAPWVKMDKYNDNLGGVGGLCKKGHGCMFYEENLELIDEDTVEFVSYSGKFPNLCSGVLVLKINGKEVIMDNSMTSGGNVGFDDDWSLILSHGEWSVKVPKEFEHLEEIISEIVNDNVPHGCCGGCS